MHGGTYTLHHMSQQQQQQQHLAQITRVETGEESVVAALNDIKMAIQSSRNLQQQEQARISSLPATSAQANCLPSSSGNIKVTANAATAAAVAAADPWQPRQAASPTPPLPLSMTDFSGGKAVEEEEDDEEEDEEDDEEEDEEDDEEEEEEEESGEDEEVSEDDEDVIEERVPTPKNAKEDEELDTDQETDRLLGQQYNDDNGYYDSKVGSTALVPSFSLNKVPECSKRTTIALIGPLSPSKLISS